MRRISPKLRPRAPEAPKRGLLARIGPGLITGASDDDPSGIATYSQVGSQFGLNMLWTMVLSNPLMSAIQEISARVGLVTGRGLAGSLRKHFPAWVLYGAIGMLFVPWPAGSRSLLFSLGIIGTGLLAAPVMAGSSAYAIGEARLWPVGLEKKPLSARGFYWVIALATLAGIGLNAVRLDPVKALFWAAVTNGDVAAPFLFEIMTLASRKKVMAAVTVGMLAMLGG